MNGLTIADTWTDFRHRVVGMGVRDDHLGDMRASFYAGAIAILETVTTLSRLDNVILGALVFDHLNAEKRAFLAETREAGMEKPLNPSASPQ
jgi:hypothetical protein